MIAIDFPLPDQSADFVRWASLMTQELADYHIAAPLSEESWQDWAQQLMALDEFNNEVPQPSAFADWRAWALRLLQNVG